MEDNKMTYRPYPNSRLKTSLLGYGMMRLPAIGGGSPRDRADAEIDQDLVNKEVAYAIQHGVNYFDTAPVYCQGRCEQATREALRPFPRSEYHITSKLSNFDRKYWSREESVKMYQQSFVNLGVDYINSYLLHGVGMGGFDEFMHRFVENGMIDYLVEERKAGRILNLGFSYHGDVRAFQWLIDHHDQYHWDFVQIEMNYVDWDYAHELNDFNQNASYLYGELEKHGIPVVVMEPCLGSRLANLPTFLEERLKKSDMTKSAASWAFRYVGSYPQVMVVLSGMTYMENLEENVGTFSPLVPLTQDEVEMLHGVAHDMIGLHTVPCNDCKYCMPCPFGVDIPGNFKYYNQAVNKGCLPKDKDDVHAATFLAGLDEAVAREAQADHCRQCKHCVPLCPQNIQIPERLAEMSQLIAKLRG